MSRLNLTALLLITLLLAACGNSPKSSQKSKGTTVTDSSRLSETYAVINQLAKSRFKGMVVMGETLKSHFAEINGKPDKQDTASPTYATYNSELTDRLIKQHYITDAEARELQLCADSTAAMVLNPAKVKAPVISQQLSDSIQAQADKAGSLEEFYRLVEKRYGTSCILTVTTPLFNASLTKAILIADYKCSPKSGQSVCLVMEKVNEGWRIISEIGVGEI